VVVILLVSVSLVAAGTVAAGGYDAGVLCSVGCGAICWEGGKVCEEWDAVLYCPGDPVPTASQDIQIAGWLLMNHGQTRGQGLFLLRFAVLL